MLKYFSIGKKRTSNKNTSQETLLLLNITLLTTFLAMTKVEKKKDEQFTSNVVQLLSYPVKKSSQKYLVDNILQPTALLQSIANKP